MSNNKSLLVCALCWVGAAALLGQAVPNPSGGPGDFFFETVDVNVVNVEVYVTDKKGEPITGLKAEDFEILEDKREVEITNFYATREGRPVLPTRVEVPVPGPGVEVEPARPDPHHFNPACLSEGRSPP